MFEILINTNFDEIYEGKIKPIDVFINYFKEKKSTTFLYWYVNEFTVPPFNQYDYNVKHEDIINLEKILIENNITFYIIISGVSTKITNELKLNPIKNIEFIVWPTYLLHYSSFGLELAYNKPIKNIKTSKDFTHLYSNLNAKPTYHRGMLIDYLNKNDLFKYGKNSWNGKMYTNTKYNFKYWKEEILKIDEYNGNEYTGYYTDNFLNLNCLINVVGETLYNNDDIFITEKTYKNLLLEQIFICLSSQFFHKNLIDFGFKLYDEIFNYDFDSKFELQDRVDGIIENLNNLSKQDYNEIYQKVSDKVKFNKNRALEIIENDLFIPETLIKLYRENKEVFLLEKNKLPYYFNDIMENKNI
jgi:hypothetical protein